LGRGELLFGDDDRSCAIGLQPQPRAAIESRREVKLPRGHGVFLHALGSSWDVDLIPLQFNLLSFTLLQAASESRASLFYVSGGMGKLCSNYNGLRWLGGGLG
jgi:hypothetical protein